MCWLLINFSFIFFSYLKYNNFIKYQNCAVGRMEWTRMLSHALNNAENQTVVPTTTKNRFSNANCFQFNLIILLEVLHVIIHFFCCCCCWACNHIEAVELAFQLLCASCKRISCFFFILFYNIHFHTNERIINN